MNYASKTISKILQLSLFFFAVFTWAFPPSAQARADRLEFSGGVSLEVQWDVGPAPRGESRARLQWTHGNGTFPVSPEVFRVRLWMPDHGHGSSPVQIRPMLGESGAPLPGAFFLSKVYFTMPGLWEIQVSLKNADGAEEARVIPVSLGRGHHH